MNEEEETMSRIVADDDLPFFILHGKDSHGPFTVAEIREQLATGSITGHSYGWNQTMEEWKPLHAIFDFVNEVPVEQGLPLAGFGRRFLAGLMDLLIIVFAFELAIFLMPIFRGWIEAASTDSALLVEVNVVLSLLVCLYYILTFAPPGGGATPGYRLLKLKLIDEATHARPNWMQCCLWCIGSFLLPVGFIFYWFDGHRRMLHNIVSKTIVVDARANP